jgi:membrane protein insertase Oxa1/YidC/SpoIIIJ
LGKEIRWEVRKIQHKHKNEKIGNNDVMTGKNKGKELNKEHNGSRRYAQMRKMI